MRKPSIHPCEVLSLSELPEWDSYLSCRVSVANLYPTTCAHFLAFNYWLETKNNDFGELKHITATGRTLEAHSIKETSKKKKSLEQHRKIKLISQGACG